MNIIPIYPEYCNSMNITEYEFCLPPKVTCNTFAPDGLLVACGEEHNCSKACSHMPEYYIPAIGVFYIQTQYKTSGSPTAAIYDLNGNVINAPSAISATIQKNYQTYRINPAKISTPCFQIKITLDEQTACTQWYRKPDHCDILEEYVSFEGLYSNKDCNAQIYGNTAFSNKLWLKGTFKYYASSIEDDGTFEYYRFYPSEAVAPFMMKYLANVVLSAKTILINDKEYQFNGSGNLAPMRSGMYLPILEFSLNCGGKVTCEN